MIDSRYRLPGYLIPKVKGKGRLLSFSLFSLLILKDASHKTSKFAVLLSKKMAKRAVVRNRVKRHLLEAVRLLLPELKAGFLIIFLPKKILLKTDFNQLCLSVKQAFKEAGIL